MKGYQDTGTYRDSTATMGMPRSMSFLGPLTVNRIAKSRQ